MDSVNLKVPDLQQVIQFINGILTFVNGGPVGWIVGGVVVLIVTYLFYKYRAVIRKWLKESSERQSQHDEADNVDREKDGSGDWSGTPGKDGSSGQTDKIVDENPDDGKKPHPEDPESLN